MKNKIYIILLGILAVILLVIVAFGNPIAPFDPNVGDLKSAYLTPNGTNLFGTDKLGRDIFSRVIYGIRTSVVISVVLVFLISTVGTILGVISGYLGGITDSVIMRISDILISCPSMVLAIALAGIMGPSIPNTMFAIFIVTVSKYIRLSRSLVLKIKSVEFIKTALISGTTNINIIKRHILPNIITPLMVTASTDIGTIILEISALSFLGFGVPSSIPELGYMISDGRSDMLYSPYLVVFPGLALFFIVSTCNLISDKIRDHLNT